MPQLTQYFNIINFYVIDCNLAKHLWEVAFNTDQQTLWFMSTRVHNSEKILIILELQRNVNKENHRRPLMIQGVSWDSLLLSNFSKLSQFIDYSMCSTDAAFNQVEFV